MDPSIQSVKKRSNLVLLLLTGIFLFLFLTITDIYICPFKLIFGIPCPGCGMTRAFIALFQFRFYDAWKLNILSIPLFLGITFISCLVFYDKMFNTSYLANFPKIKLSYIHYSLLAMVTLVSWITNITRGI